MFVFDCRSGLHSMAFKSKRYGMQDSPRWRRFVDLAGHQGASFASGHRHFCALNKHTEPSICLVEGIIPCPQLTRCLKRRHFFAPESFCKPSRRRCRLHVRSSDLIELSMRHHYAQWLAVGSILGGWARSASGETSDGISWIEDGTRNYRATGAVLAMPFIWH
jgi:hypothetical protein